MTSTPRPIVVIGGGIAGLVSAAIAAKAVAPVVLPEKASALGGRAATRQKNGFWFNLGPHALYRRGVLNQTLSQLGGGRRRCPRRKRRLCAGERPVPHTARLVARRCSPPASSLALNRAGKISEIYVVSATAKLTAIR